MPTNAGPEFKAAEARYRSAATPSEQLAALQEMLSTLPKHKGTEKVQADIKRRISEVKREAAHPKKGGHRPFYMIDRAEGGQTALVGPPNAGKSLLLRRLTNAEPEVAPYPYTTHVPTPGMMPYDNVMVQLLDLPAAAREGSEPWLFDVIRRADVLVIVVDAADDDALAQLDDLFELLEARAVETMPADAAEQEDEQLLAKRALIVANKADLPAAGENLPILREFYAERLPILAVSAETGEGLEELRSAIFDALHVIRVYTKAPGEPAARTRPFLLPRGSTVLDAARSVHADFAEKLKYARIWGDDRFDGQMVSREDELRDGDLLEFHI